MVRKLNATKHLCRIDPSFIEEVSDDEVKSALPVISSFMNITLGGAGNGHSQPHPHASQDIHLDDEIDRPVDNCQAIQNLMSDQPWPWTVVSNIDPGPTTGPTQTKSLPTNFHTLGPIYLFNEVSKNKQQLDITKIPNAILQMAYLKLFIPLSMLMSSSLAKICANNGLKYHKIPFGNGAGKQSLDESIFLPEYSLSESLFSPSLL